MLGVRFGSSLLKSVTQSLCRSSIPKFSFSIMNLETTSLLNRTSLLPSNLVIKNMIEMLEKIKDQSEKDQDKSISTLTLIKSVLSIGHIKTNINDRP